MSIRIMSIVWELHLPDSQKLVLLALADCASDEGRAWPSIATISRKCSRSERTVQGVMIELEKIGHISRVQIPGKGCNYTVHPRSDCGAQPLRDAVVAGRSEQHPTPAAAAPKPSRTITPQKASPSSVKRVSKPKPSRLPEDWRPVKCAAGTVAREIIDRRGQEWARAALESFHHWAVNAEDKDGKGRKSNWQAAWANWVIEQDRRDGRNGNRIGIDGVGGGNGRSPPSALGRTIDAGFAFIADGEPH